VAEVIETLTPCVAEVKDSRGRAYSLRIHPCLTQDNKIDGAVVALVDLDLALTSMEPVAEPVAESTRGPRAFGAGLLMAQEKERRDLALELHDDLSQRLALLELTIDTLEQSDPSKDQRHWKDQLHAAHEQIRSLSSSLRKIAYHLYPAALEHLGLAQTVESFVREFGDREHMEIQFHAESLLGAIEPHTALCLYRIVQESLQNIARHSKAKSAEVSLSRYHGVIQLRVKDAGAGFDFDSVEKKGGLGLRSMEERARACGGSFQINAQPGEGTEIVVRIPDTPGSAKQRRS